MFKQAYINTSTYGKKCVCVCVCVCECVHPYLKVGELRVVEVRVDVQRGSNHQQRFKLVQWGAYVAGEAQTPDFQQSLQVKQYSEGNLDGEERKGKFSRNISTFCFLRFKEKSFPSSFIWQLQKHVSLQIIKIIILN